MCVRVVPLSQASSRDLLYVKCVCVLSRYLRPVVEICYMLNVCACCACCPVISGQCRDLLYVKCVCVLSRYLRPVSRDLLYVKCVCVLSVISGQLEIC